MSEEILLVEKAPEGYAVLTLNRPQSLNAWSVALCTRFCEAFSALQEDDAIRAIILTGSGRAFCAGLDVKEMRADPDAFFARVRAHSPGVAVQAGRKPMIGAINGDAVTGGFEIAMLCDVLICSENASFMDTHTRIGLMPGWGISQLLSRRVGISRANEISLTARRVGAAEAAAIGLVNAVYPRAQLLDEARRIAREMLAGVPRILTEYHRLIDDGFGLPLREALALERERVRESRQRPVGS
jgi:enoyl-CoA hydratase